MNQSAYAKARDHRVANETVDDRDQMCPAHGCPLRWSVSGSRGKACSAHYFGDRSQWARITADMRRLEEWRAVANAAEAAGALEQNLTRAEKGAILARLQKLGRDPGSDRGWALFLRDQHAAGRRLTRFQVDAYRSALPRNSSPP